MKPHSSAILLACILTGCMQRPPKEPFHEQLPSSWKAPIPISDQSDAKTFAQVTEYQVFDKTSYQWWELFQNNQLNKLVDDSFGANFSMKAYFARVEEALAAAGISLSDLYPHLTIGIDAERNLVAKSKRLQTKGMNGATITMPPPGSTLPPTFTPIMQKQTGPKFNNDLLINLGFSYEVDLWGKFRMAYDASKERITESQEQYRAAQLNLAANIANNFYRSLYYITKIELINKQLKALKELVSIEDDKFTSGYTRKDQLLTAQSTREIALIDKATAELLHSQADDLLAVLSGLPPELYNGPSESSTLYLPNMPSTIPSTLLLQRPDISALRAEVRARALEVGVAQADIFPSLTLGAGIGFESNKANTLLKWKNHIWNIASSVSYDLFDAGRKASIVNLNKALFRESMAQYQERVLEAIQEVDDALFALQEAKTNLNNEMARNRELQERTSLSHSRFQAGLAPKTEYLEGLVELYQEEQNLSQRKLTYLQASISLLTALGGTWDTKASS